LSTANGIPHRQKSCFDNVCANVWEKAFNINIQKMPLPEVKLSVCEVASPPSEAMHAIMESNLIKYIIANPPLNYF